jgi:hypothetical protein
VRENALTREGAGILAIEEHFVDLLTNAQEREPRLRNHQHAASHEAPYRKDAHHQPYDRGRARDHRLIVKRGGAADRCKQRRSSEAAEGRINGAERTDEKVRARAEPRYLRNPAVVCGRTSFELCQLGDDDSSSVDDPGHPVGRPKREHRASVRENRWCGDGGQRGERIFGQVLIVNARRRAPLMLRNLSRSS